MAFGLTQYERVVLLDSDMLVLQNMDELIEMELDTPQVARMGQRVFAAGHACICNPLKKPQYPRDWSREKCAFSSQHDTPLTAQTTGPRTDTDLPNILNTGLLVINPSTSTFNYIIEFLRSDTKLKVDFAEQSLLSELFHGRWVPLPYTYNALKTLRWRGVHSEIWRDECVKNIHYILTPKPWEEIDAEGKSVSKEPTHQWWAELNLERRNMEQKSEIPHDSF
ncbi:putative glycosyl transferase family protein [Erysiphe necator]|uniref:Putative glycosyl transferase family protein n=1 Tax=Uncinula necator TaxID=52586 RepID=A0A0B1NVI1_UNCNE|nr:putative glycosyl transferase family protein [Erysiphe necator]